jgi:hypothetical protein
MSGIGNSPAGVVGAAVPSVAAPIAGSDGTNLRLIKTDSSGVVQVSGTVDGDGTSNSALASWTSSTVVGTSVSILSASFKFNTLLLTVNLPGGMSAGQMEVEVSNDNFTSTVALTGVYLLGASTGYYQMQQSGSPVIDVVMYQSGYVSFLYNISGWQYVRVRLTQAIVGAGTVSLGYALQSVAQPFQVGTNITSWAGLPVKSGVGSSGSGVPRVTVSNDSAVKLWDGINVANVSTKGTQGTNAVQVQNYKDSGRTDQPEFLYQFE